MTDQPNYYGKNVAFDEETEAIVRREVTRRGFPENQGFSLALRLIIKEWDALQQARMHVPNHGYEAGLPVGG